MGTTRALRALVASLGAFVCACSGSSTPASKSTAPLTVAARSASTRALAARTVAQIDVANADGLAAVAGFVFVKTDDGRVIRIDPTTNRITGRLKVDTARDPSHYCQGIGTDGTSVWACAASDKTTDVVRIDPARMTVETTVAVDKVFDQLTLPHNAAGIWVLSKSGIAVTVVDPETGQVTSQPLGAHCQQLAASDERVVATCANDNTALTLDAGSGKVTARVRLAEPRLAVTAGDRMWIDTADGLTLLGKDLSKVAVYSGLVAGLDGDLALTSDGLWLRGSGGTLSRVDANRNAVVEQLLPPTPLSAGSLLVTDDSFWLSANNEGIVLRFRR